MDATWAKRSDAVRPTWWEDIGEANTWIFFWGRRQDLDIGGEQQQQQQQQQQQPLQGGGRNDLFPWVKNTFFVTWRR